MPVPLRCRATLAGHMSLPHSGHFCAVSGFPVAGCLCSLQRAYVLVSAQVRLVVLFLLAWLGVGKLLEQTVYRGLLKWGRHLSAFCFGISRSTEIKSSPWAQQSPGQCRRWLRREDSCYQLLLELFCGCYNNLQLQWAPECPPVHKEKGVYKEIGVLPAALWEYGESPLKNVRAVV